MSVNFLLAAAADASWWERARRNPNSAFSTSELLLGLAAISAVALVWWLWTKWRRWHEQRLFSSPSGLFTELCLAHRLTRRQRADLWMIARAQRLAQPAEVFLRPELYWPPHIPPRLAPRQREIAQLHAHIFGSERQASP